MGRAVDEGWQECANCWWNPQEKPEDYEEQPAYQSELQEDGVQEEGVEHEADQLEHAVAWNDDDGDWARAANISQRAHANMLHPQWSFSYM